MSLTGTVATVVDPVVEPWLPLASEDDEEDVVLALPAPEETRLEQDDEPVCDFAVLLEVVDVPLVVLDEPLSSDSPLTGPPNALSEVIGRAGGAVTWLAGDASALAASLGAVEAVASTSLAIAWIAVGAAAEVVFSAPRR